MNKFEKKALAKRAYRALVKRAEGPYQIGPTPQPVLKADYSTPAPAPKPQPSTFLGRAAKGISQIPSRLNREFSNMAHDAVDAYRNWQERRKQPTPEQQKQIDDLSKWFSAQASRDYETEIVRKELRNAAKDNDEYNRLATWNDNIGGYPGGYNDGLQPNERSLEVARYMRDSSRRLADRWMQDAMIAGDSWKPEPANWPINIKGKPVYPTYPRLPIHLNEEDYPGIPWDKLRHK